MLFPPVATILSAWAQYLSTPRGKWLTAYSMLIALPVFYYEIHLLLLWDMRPGAVITDKVMHFFTPFNFSVPIFVLIYAVVFLGIYHLAQQPDYLLKGLQAYLLVRLLRCAAIYFMPLEPPADMILLRDPLAGFFLTDGGRVVTKDLFFSGHTSTIFIFYFAFHRSLLKQFTLLAGTLVPLMLVWQHVHYTADVLAAPVISYFAVKCIEKLYQLLGDPWVWRAPQ
ncbi:MAG: phosphatase PAP2-related protein [Chitinophagales bacterium]